MSIEPAIHMHMQIDGGMECRDGSDSLHSRACYILSRYTLFPTLSRSICT
jgi:hypothetical protein